MTTFARAIAQKHSIDVNMASSKTDDESSAGEELSEDDCTNWDWDDERGTVLLIVSAF